MTSFSGEIIRNDVALFGISTACIKCETHTDREATVRNRLLLLSSFNLLTTRKLPKSSKLSFTTHYHVFLLKWSQCVASGYNSLI